MHIEELLRRYLTPVFAPADEGAAGDTSSGAGGDADNGAQGDGETKSTDAPGAVLNAGSADGDDKADTDTDASKSAEGEDADGKSDEDKDGKDDKADDVVPEEYAFTMPEGVELDTAMADTMSPLFKELGITQGQADKLVAAYAGQVQAGADVQAQTFVKTITDWTEAARTDKEIGNDNWDNSVKAANGALQKLGTPELTKALAETGMSNHPEMIRFMARAAKAIGADTFEPGDDNVDTGDVSAEASWYGKTTPATKKG